MKALYVTEPGRLELADVSKPSPGPSEVLAKIGYCGICGTDMAIYTGNSDLVRSGMVHYPVPIGHEWSGIVEAVGGDVSNVRPGDRVVSVDGVNCGQCPRCVERDYAYCPDGRALGTVGEVWAGAFAEYIRMPASHIYKLPDNVALDEAALIEPAGIAMQGLKKAGVAPGCTILVVGTGSIGLSAVALARQMGAAKVLLAGRRDSKLAIGRAMGADVLVNTSRERLTDAARAHSWRGLGVDVLLESSGNASVMEEALDCVHPLGVISLVGFFERPLRDFPVDKLVLNGIDLRGAAGNAGVTVPILNFLGQSRVSFRPLISGVYPFAEYERAFARMLGNDDMRIKLLLKMD